MASTSLSQDARIAQNPIKDRKHEQDVTEVASGSAEQLELSSKQEHGDTDVPKDPSKSLDQIFDLLRAKDDNSRFVGLALLKPVLDKQADLQNDAGILERCWAAIPAKFLDRLLKAGANEKKSKEESISMVELAVAVMHAFIRLLPQNLQDNTKIIGRIKGLINALGWSSPETKTQILQILVTLASTNQGPMALLYAENWSKLMPLAPQQELVLEVIKHVFVNIFLENTRDSKARQAFDTMLCDLIALFRDCPRPFFFKILNETFTSIAKMVFSPPLPWLEPLADLIIQSCLDRREATSFQNRQYAVPLTVTLLTINPLDFSSMLFGAKATSDNSLDSKPTSYLFTKLLLIDIKATIPSLQEILNSAEFPATSIRMSGSYCIICTFMKFLMQMLDQADVSPISSSINNKLSDSVSFPPSLLLQLRADISETLSLTIEFLRDRFDASIAGAANLHPSASSGIEDARSPATIPFNSSSTIMGRDTLTLSQFCTLAIWLHEDDNKALRKEAAGIMDLLFHFYNPEDDKLDFRSPVLTALLGIFAIPEGVNAFFALDGWSILVNDLQSIFLTPSPELAPLGIEIVNVLLAVVESDVTGPAKEWWLDIVSLASVTRLVPEHMMLDLRVSIAQLALELLDRSPKRVMKRHMRDLRKLLDLSKKLLRGTIGEDTRERLEGIVVGLEVLADS